LDNLQIQEKLAETGGSNCGIYSVSIDGWTCAMKELYIEDQDETTVANFEREIELLEQLPYHPNIVRYLFHTTNESTTRLFMTKYASSLRKIINDRLKNNQPFTVTQVLKYGIEITKGVVFLHSNNIIHRDLKSDNIFISLNERKEIANLAIGDFDTAKNVAVEKQAKTIIGTPGWIAPEVLMSKDEGGYSEKADVYSFGMILYELLTLKIPYYDVDYIRRQAIVLSGIPPNTSDIPEDYDPIVKIFLECIAFNPDNRPDAKTLRTKLTAELANVM